ncbi:MAG TPA: serine/threonine protein kinase [Pirellulales bacterium]|nr:serine/threonine protein kinase [Pirellulales bacterium]
MNPGEPQTPVMGQDDRQRSRELSLRQLYPPLKVPGYEQEKFVGRGAFGEVWSAIDSNSGRQVAIKFYSHRGVLDWSNMAREVEKLRFLFANRYVVQLFEVGWDSDPPFFVMEYMPTGSLADRIRQGPLPVPEAVRLFREIATGLVQAHGRGVLHCDLKPSNIMLDEDGRPRLADFGQSRLSHEHLPSLGTFFYMAPEQADPQALPDVRWDVYALGAILYQLIVGTPPYQTAESLATLSAKDTLHDKLAAYRHHLECSTRPSEHRRAPGMDSALATIINRCLALDPARRYSNVQEVMGALDERERRRAQKPLVQLGAIGPTAVVVVMALIALAIVNAVLSTAQRQLVERTLESNRFAAHLVASRFALEIDKRWRCMEHEAAAPPLQKALAEAVYSAPSEPDGAELQSWLEGRHQFWNTQFSSKTAAAYWFVLDRRGSLLAISPPNPGLVGQSFAYRDYFHGQGDDLSNHGARPINVPHRSNVFLSQPGNILSVAFSVPIRDAASQSREPLGVLVMEADLGHFAEFLGARHQFAAIVDLRPDETGREGLIAEHPQLQNRPVGSLRTYIPDAMLADLKRLSARHLQQAPAEDLDVGEGEPGGAEGGQFEFYRDPLDPQPDDLWLCSSQPTVVSRGSGRRDDTGWIVLIEERRQEVLHPLHRFWRTVVYGGLVAIALVTLILTALWIYVLWHLSEERGARRFLKRLVGMSESLRSTAGSTTARPGATERPGAMARSGTTEPLPPEGVAHG